MKTLAIEFKGSVDKVYAQIPVTRSGFFYSGGAWKNAPERYSDQCPDCGADLAETWTIFAENPGIRPTEGESFRAECECGYRTTGQSVEIDY